MSTSHSLLSFITTIAMPLPMRASLDVIRAQRAAVTGLRPPIRALVLEALTAFIERELSERT